MPQRSYARPHHQSAIRGERLAKERLRCHGLDASLCRRIHFRRMPSVNDGPPDSGFAATSLLAGSPTSRINCSAVLAFCSFSRLALGLDLLSSFAFCLCGSLHLRDPGSFSLCLPRRLALGFSRSVALRLLDSFTLRSLDGFEPRLLCCLALRLLRSFAPGF